MLSVCLFCLADLLIHSVKTSIETVNDRNRATSGSRVMSRISVGDLRRRDLPRDYPNLHVESLLLFKIERSSNHSSREPQTEKEKSIEASVLSRLASLRAR